MGKISYRSISISVMLSFVLSLFFLLLFSPPLHAQSLNLTIGNYQLLSSKRLSSTVWEYYYTADMTNGSMETAFGVTARVKSAVPTTKVIRPELNFGNMPPGETRTSPGFFVLQIDRRYPLEDKYLTWKINYTGCPPPDECHSLSSWDPVGGCVFADQRTMVNISPTLQRFSWWRPNGQVDLYESDSCISWKGEWFVWNEPHDNYCGPTAAMNLLWWYGDPAASDQSFYHQLGDEMNTNNWMSGTDILLDCLCLCSGCPFCTCPEPVCSGVCYALVDKFFDVGTHPDDLEKTLHKHSPAGYRLYRGQGNPGLETFKNLLGQGNPIVVLIWTGERLHWTTVIGTYDQDGTTMVRFANNKIQVDENNVVIYDGNGDPATIDLTWDWFVHQWSFEGMDWPAGDILSRQGIDPYVWMVYQQTTELRAGQELRIGDNYIISQDGRFTLMLDGAGNLVLYQMFPEGITYYWSSSTLGRGCGAQVAVMQDDGNFVIYDYCGDAIWDSNTHGNPGAYLALQNDGNVVIYSSDNTEALWSTHTCCH